MPQSEFGTTVFEQVPREFRGARRKSPIALIIVILVVILFGGFWLYQERMVNTAIEEQPAPIVTPTPETSTPPPTQEQPSVSAMQEDAVNIAIPDYSDQF